MSTPSEDKPPFWVSKRNRQIMWVVLYGSCAITLLLEFFVHPEHAFHFVGFPMASAVLGLVACSLMIVGAKGLATFLKKKEDYYDQDESL